MKHWQISQSLTTDSRGETSLTKTGKRIERTTGRWAIKTGQGKMLISIPLEGYCFVLFCFVNLVGWLVGGFLFGVVEQNDLGHVLSVCNPLR